MPYLGLAQLSTYLRRTWVTVYTLDLNIDVYRRIPEEAKSLWENESVEAWTSPKALDKLISGVLSSEVKYCAQRILELPADIVGFSVYRPNRLFTIKVIEEVIRKDPSRVIVVGGGGCSSATERADFPRSLVDVFVVGEGEEVLAKVIRSKGDFSGIRGTIVPVSDDYIDNGVAKPVDINRISFPTFEEFDLNNYTEKALPILASRGCIARCAFCEDHLSWDTYRYRRAEVVFDEIRWHVKNNGISYFWFNDLLINASNKNLEKLCDLIIENGIDIRWIALAMVRRDTTEALLRKMRSAGCYTLNYGIESGSDRILKKMRAPYTVSDAERVLELTRRADINTQLNFIVGFPGETETEFAETLQFIRRNREWICGISSLNTCTLVQNSPMGKNPGLYGALPRPGWEPVSRRFETEDGTCYEERVERIKRAASMIQELGLSIWTTNAPHAVRGNSA
jgi:radical SAM superfamily enzyme YgiQ (UPF0313 family)